MATTPHKGLTGTDIHVPNAWTYADSTERESATGFDTSDLYKFAIQTDNNSVWMLTAITPTWVELNSGGSFVLTDGNATTANGTAVDLGGTATATVQITPDTTDSYDFNVGTSAGNRFSNASLFATDTSGVNTGDGSVSSFASTSILSSEPGSELGVLRVNNTQFSGIQVNLIGSGKLLVTDNIDGEGLTYAADYSGSFVSRSLVDKNYVDLLVNTLSIYTADGTLTGARTVTGNTGDSLTFEHYNGNSSNYTLRSELLLDDNDITISSHLGDGFGADIASQSISMLSTGMEIALGINDSDVYLSGNDLIFYKGANNTTNENITIHGDGNHSAFDPWITLHEGFATGNGTNAQPLITNFGKGVRVQFNDGTRSVDTFHIESVVNGAETFTHMETSFESVRHDYVLIDRFDWYFDTSATTGQWTIYDDDAGSNVVFSLDNTGKVAIASAVDIGSSVSLNDAVTQSLVLNTGELDAILYNTNSTTYTARSELDMNSSSFQIGTYVGDGVGTDTSQKVIESSSANGILVDDTTDSKGLRYGGDYSANWNTDRYLVDKGYVDSFASPSMLTGAATNQTATTTDAVITLDSTDVDGSGSEYTINLANNRIDLDTADGSKIYEVIWHANYDLDGQATTGATRSYAIITARLDAVNVSGSQHWTYIREYQGGTNGIPNNGGAGVFLIQPAANDQLDFVFRGVTAGGETLTDFELAGFHFTIKRVS